MNNSINLVERLNENIPAAMREARRWLLRQGKRPFFTDGEPWHARPGADAKLATFADACEALERDPARWSGLSFATGGGWQGIDLDDLSDRPALAALVDRLPGYRERSLSGNGLHIFGFGDVFPNLGSNGSGIECYSQRKPLTVTGIALGGEITDIEPFIARELKPLHARGNATPGQERSPDPDADWMAVTPALLGELRDALAAIPADGYADWIRFGHALAGLGDPGRELWLDWSQTSDKFQDGDSEKWDTFKGSETSYKAIFAEAKRRGWKNPAQSRGDSPEAPSVIDYTPPSVIDLSDIGHIEIRPEPYILAPIIPRGEVTLLAGNGGSGKSLLALAMGAHVAVGEPWGPFASEGEPRRVLFVSMEDHPQRIRGRLQRITDAYCLDPETLREHFTALDATEAGAIAEEDDRGRGLKFLPLFDAIAQQAKRADLVILDNASDAFDANENARRQVRAFVKALAHMVRGHGGAVLLLAHLDKTGARYGTAGNSYSGSTAWNNSARSRLALLDGELVHEKANTGKKHPEPIGIEWTDSGVPRPTDRAATRKRNATPTQRRAFEALLTAIDGSDRPSADLEAWRGEFYARHEADSPEAKRQAFLRARRDLTAGNAVEVCGERYSVTGGGRWLDLFALVEAWREKGEFFGYLQ